MNQGPGRILVVDDDPLVRDALAASLVTAGHLVTTAQDARSALRELEREPPELVLCDLRLPGMNGLELLHALKTRHPELRVIVMTAYGSIESAVTAMKNGALDYVTKPIDDQLLRQRVGRALEEGALRRENDDLRRRLDQVDRRTGIVAGHPSMQRVLASVDAVASTRATVLIRGESGTGKTILARAIHALSERRDRPFVEVSCGSLPDPLLESELFGYEAGAFTGAVRSKPGKFELADSGTIFLDEIANATPALQVKLLRILQDRVFEHLGGTRSIECDVRLVLATNADLERAVREGRFREDLFYRINVVAIELPPLRERRDDIPALAELFLRRYARDYGKEVRGLAPAALRFFMDFDWPGNVRELENVVEHAVVMAKGEVIQLDDLPGRYGGDPKLAAAELGIRPLKEAMEAPERDYILQVLKMNGGNRQKTAEMLQVNRTTLFNKMRKYDLFDADLDQHGA
ncbi:MAG: sigma-54-dependent Fis family transcriptional regulator [Planctomycetes bacterium]|nr:sigma-54-dependent Fis family transcriptional regulator [Planctomycetota bacterium]